MAEPSQYSFELREIAELLIKQQDLHEGRWVLGFEFNLGAAVFGPTPAEARPSAFVQVNKFLLTRPPDNAPVDAPFIVDASVVNPQSKPASKKKAAAGK